MEINFATAYANALYNALGIRFTELPITAEKIVNAIIAGQAHETREKSEKRASEALAVMQAAE